MSHVLVVVSLANIDAGDHVEQGCDAKQTNVETQEWNDVVQAIVNQRHQLVEIIEDLNVHQHLPCQHEQDD